MRAADPRGEGHSLPPDVAPYKRTATFTENTIPAGLMHEHRTAAGVWGLLHVLAGRLIYRIAGPKGSEHEIGAGDPPGVIEPERLHELRLLGPVQFYVEFHRRPD